MHAASAGLHALVQAVKKFPGERHYTEVDGKPTAVTPAHTNLGLAIDLQGKDGKRSLVVARHQAVLRDHAIRAVRSQPAEKDIVRRALTAS